MEALDTFENQWYSTAFKNNASYINKIIYQNININPSDAVDVIDEKFEKYSTKLINIYNELNNESLIDDIDVKIRINRLMETIYYSRQIVVANKRVSMTLDTNVDYSSSCDASLLKFSALELDDNSKYQNFLLYLLEYTYRKQYAKYNGDVYRQIFTNKGINSRAWKYVCEIPELIYSSVNKNENYEQFINLTSRGDCVRNATEFLTNYHDSQFPLLVKNRHAFSFQNGIYFAKVHDEKTNTYHDKFVKYEDLKFEKEEYQNICCAKYFNQNFDNAPINSYVDIETPVLDSILDYQEFSDDIKQWVYVFIGRLIYETNDLDGWQVIFFFQGQAGTGKSTLTLNVCKALYDEEDVGVISNNIQKKFGLADIVNSLLYVAPEIKRDFSMEQGEFQSIISGDKVTINIKHQKSSFVNWKIPGIMAGNETPDFVDNSGSIQRRIVTLKFDKRVIDGDMSLGKKLQQEMHAIIRKCNLAYLDKANTIGNKNVWNFLPEYFKNTQRQLAQATNPLMHFLSNGKLDFAKGGYIPEKLFIQEFNDHCIENNYKRPRFNGDFYSGPFSMHGIKVVKGEKRRFPPDTGRLYNGTFFENVTFLNEYTSSNTPEENIYDKL